jgi:hypothetical protein
MLSPEKGLRAKTLQSSLKTNLVSIPSSVVTATSVATPGSTEPRLQPRLAVDWSLDSRRRLLTTVLHRAVKTRTHTPFAVAVAVATADIAEEMAGGTLTEPQRESRAATFLATVRRIKLHAFLFARYKIQLPFVCYPFGPMHNPRTLRNTCTRYAINSNSALRVLSCM